MCTIYLKLAYIFNIYFYSSFFTTDNYNVIIQKVQYNSLSVNFHFHNKNILIMKHVHKHTHTLLLSFSFWYKLFYFNVTKGYISIRQYRETHFHGNRLPHSSSGMKPTWWAQWKLDLCNYIDHRSRNIRTERKVLFWTWEMKLKEGKRPPRPYLLLKGCTHTHTHIYIIYWNKFSYVQIIILVNR